MNGCLVSRTLLPMLLASHYVISTCTTSKTYSYPATGRCSERHRCAITDRLEGSSIYRHWLRGGTVVTGELSRRRGDHFRIRALCNPRDQRFRSVSSRKHPIERDPFSRLVSAVARFYTPSVSTIIPLLSRASMHPPRVPLLSIYFGRLPSRSRHVTLIVARG